MCNETALTNQREITPATPQIIGGIVDITCNTQTEKAQKAKMVLFCHENNLPYNLAFNGGLYIVNGRMAVEGDVIRSKISQSGKYHQKVEHSDDKGCTLSIWQKASSNWPYHLYDGQAEPGDWVKMGEVSFTEKDATRAGLIKKDTYQKYSIDMYLNRATSRARRFFMSDLFNQPVYVHGEIEGTDFETEKTIPGNHRIVQSQNGTELDGLIMQYGPDAVFAANGNQTPNPHNGEQVARIKEVLEAQTAEEPND